MTIKAFFKNRAPPLEIKTLDVIFLTAKIAVKQETIAKELIKTSQSSHPLKQRGDLMSLATMNFRSKHQSRKRKQADI